MGLPADDYMLDMTGTGFASSRVSGTSEQQRYYWYVVHRVPEMPSVWHENNHANHPVRYKTQQEVTLDADCTVNTYYRNLNQIEGTDVSGAQTAHWHSEEHDNYMTRDVFSQFPSGSINDKPMYTITEISYTFEADSTSDEIIVYNEFFESIHDDSYSGEAAEIIERDGTGQLHEAKMPVSSWLIMRVLIDTLNKIMYESTPAFNVPVFGEYNQK